MLFASIVISFKTRFIQIRALPLMMHGLLGEESKKEGSGTILPRHALYTAMSTTIGTASIVSPILAIRLGGPGALFGFLLTTLFGSASIFAEVTFAVSHRKKLADGTIMGGPMQYLKDEFHPFMAQWYAFFGLILFTIWSGWQVNVLADMLEIYRVPPYVTGISLALVTTYVLIGGIKRIGHLSAKIVPFMFFLYTLAALWVIIYHIADLPAMIRLIIMSAFSQKAITGGAAAGGVYHALRWGLLKGFQANESGFGTSTIPHSMAETESATAQGILAMAATYAHGFICLLSGLVTLLTGTWNDPNLKFGINIATQAFYMHFSYVGPLVLMISVFLFAFGTILGNSYNGSQCFSYLTNNTHIIRYYIVIGFFIFFGALADVEFLWNLTDFFAILIAIPHIIGILILSFKRSDLLNVP